MAAPQIPLNQILQAMDRKDRDFYDNLDDELKKKFSPFLMVKYSASVTGDSGLEHYYIASTNHYANINLFDLAKHPKLQWLMLTAASPGLGSKNHKWLKQKPLPKNVSAPIKKQLLTLFPTMKEADIDTLAAITTKKELKQYVKDRGDK